MASKFRDDIQGLRALAVLLVVIYHSTLSFFDGGYIGVDVFFVISGYLIAGMLIEELSTTGTIKLLPFYARRIRRLLPAATIVLICTIFLAQHIYSPLEFKQFSSAAVATATYLSNFWFAHLATDYLAHNASPSPLLHTWSLSVEEQFYVIWPLLLLGIAKLAGSGSRSKALVIGVLVITFASFIACLKITAQSQPWGFFMAYARAWEFGLGAIVAITFSNLRAIRGHARSIGQLIGFGLILIPAIYYSNRTPFPGFAAIPPVLGTCLLLGLPPLGNSQWNAKILSNRVARFFGDISYSLYLWHWPVFVFWSDVVPEGLPLAPLWQILASTMLATCTYYCVENPFRFNRYIASSIFRSFTSGVVISVVALTIAFYLRSDAARGIETGEQQRYAQALNELPLVSTNGCHRNYAQIESGQSKCEFGSSGGEKTIVLFGDSHSAHWFPTINNIATEVQSKLISFTKSGCPSIDFEPYAEQIDRTYRECSQWREGIFATLEKIKPETIVISNHYHYRNGRDSATNSEQWGAAMRQMINKLANTGANILIIGDVPQLNFWGTTCLARAQWQGTNPNKVCTFDVNTPHRVAFSEAEFKVATDFPRVHWVDMTPELCTASATDACPLERDGLVLYRDDNHLTVAFVNQLTDRIKQHAVFNSHLR